MIVAFKYNHNKTSRLNNDWIVFFALWCFQTTLGAIWLYIHLEDFSVNFLQETPEFITYDSLLYRYRAIEFSQIYNLYNLNDWISFIDLYGLNYSFISIIGSLAQTQYGFNDWYVFLFNGLLLAITYQALYDLCRVSKVKPYWIVIVLAFFMYIPFSLIQLNKEIYGFVFIVLMMKSLYKKSHLSLLLLCVTLGLVRSQYLAMALLLILFPRPRLLLLLLTINLAVYIGVDPMLAEWWERVNDMGATSTTLNFMLKIEALAYIPVVGLFGYLSRILLSLLTGLYSPIKIISDFINNVPFDIIYHSGIFILSVLFLIALYQHYKVVKYKYTIAPIYYTNLFVFIVFVSLNSIAPFLQPRYYMPLILLLLVNQACFQSANKERVKFIPKL